jgi:hypothetical protein
MMGHFLRSEGPKHSLSPWNDRLSRCLWKLDPQVLPEMPETFGVRGITRTFNKTNGCLGHLQK